MPASAHRVTQKPVVPSTTTTGINRRKAIMLIMYVYENGKQAAFNSDLFVMAEWQDDGTTLLTLLRHLPAKCECGRLIPSELQPHNTTHQVVTSTSFAEIMNQMDQATGVFA
jgi:hypothetical protein